MRVLHPVYSPGVRTNEILFQIALMVVGSKLLGRIRMRCRVKRTLSAVRLTKCRTGSSMVESEEEPVQRYAKSERLNNKIKGRKGENKKKKSFCFQVQ